jgi:hypothetical protein
MGDLVLTGLSVAGGVYGRRRDGDLTYEGPRPGEGWHRHGSFRRRLLTVVRGSLTRVFVQKQRWLEVATGRTCHSRPPDDLPWLHFCSLVIAVRLWSWLDGEHGVQSAPVVVVDEQDRPCPRTVQRWQSRAQPCAMEIQQAIRLAVIERSEPRPVETLFPGGLSPPGHMLRRPWRDPPALDKLWRALAMLLGGALGLCVPAAVLLAEARGRWDETTVHACL